MFQKKVFFFASVFLSLCADKTKLTPFVDAVPCARFEAKNGIELYSSAEALLFHLRQDDYPIGYLTNITEPPVAGAQYGDEQFHYRQHWKWGFRLCAGYHFKHDSWDLEANYMRFTAVYNREIMARTQREYRLVSGVQVNKIATADNKRELFRWSVNFNQWDLVQSKTFRFSEYFRFKPGLGLRNLILGQGFTTHVVNRSDAHLYAKNFIHFWGMGVLATLDTIWSLNRQFSLYGKVGLSSLFGHYSNSLFDEISFYPATVTYPKNLHKNSKSCLDLAIGAQFDKNFYNDQFHLGINIGFEQHSYFNMNKSFYGFNQAVTFDGSSGRDFVMQGFTFGLRADY